jgi:hypothetical protein
LSSDPEIRRDVPDARHGGHGRPLPAFFAPSARIVGPPVPEAWATPAPRAASPAAPASVPPPAARSPFPLEAIEID